jgi:glycosyltransferase involved in cell wall biosynthesis
MNALDPGGTLFAALAFEGPDVYSQAGGVGVRVKGLTTAMAARGLETHLFFVGDPDLPSEEVSEGVVHHRWAQWISAHNRRGVYEGEEAKVEDWNRSLPSYLVDRVVAPAVERGRCVVLLGEDWHTAASMVLIADELISRGIRQEVVLFWNANGVYGFDRIDWPALARSVTLTTVSRYMKHRLWGWGVNPIVIPNGLPAAALETPNEGDVEALRRAAGEGVLCVKVGRFDPDKRWLGAIASLRLLKREGLRVRLIMRGGMEPHGAEVLGYARALGLGVDSVDSPSDLAGLARLLGGHPDADILNFVTFMPGALLPPLFAAADFVLANSGHEPFGLVGLEVMAAGGLAVTGATGEDYALPFRNAVVLETDDPRELVTAVCHVRARPALEAELRAEGGNTARAYAWTRVMEQLDYWVGLAAQRQSPGGDRPIVGS